MADETQTKLDQFTGKYAEGFEKFSNSKSGNLILDFVMFRKNILQYTLQIVFISAVLIVWVVAIAGIFGEGPVAMVARGFIQRLGIGIGLFALAPFVLHYCLELVKIAWTFLAHVYEKVLVPIWNTIVIRFFANVAPQILPFLYERFMKVVDICIDKLAPFLDTVIDGVVAVFMTVAALLKGTVWLPKAIAQRIERWASKANAEGASK